MTLEAKYYKNGDVMEHTPSSALTGGQVIQLNSGIVAVPLSGIAADAAGTVQVSGIMAIRNTAVAGGVGMPVWWDENGTAVDTSTGACTVDGSAGDFYIGYLVKDLAATDKVAYVMLNAENPFGPACAGKTVSKKTADYTVLGTDNGTIILVDGSAEGDDTIILTMTAVVTLGDGFEVTIMNAAGAGASICIVEVDNADKFLNPVALDDGDVYENTLLTSKRGDFVTIRSSAAGWYVMKQRGTWADGGAS
jgi:predicted RecA/RadA family phage recombinase